MLTDTLSALIIIRVLPDVFIILFYSILVLAAADDAFIQFGAVWLLMNSFYSIRA
jgi:hypothetical protein